jgi:RNase P subunit RPR2
MAVELLEINHIAIFKNYSKEMKKVQRMLNFHTYKRLFCANCDVIA